MLAVDADEVRRIVGAAGSNPPCSLWVRTQWSCANRASRQSALGQNRGRCNAVFYPIDHSLKDTNRIGPRSPSAVSDAWRQEEAGESVYVRGPSITSEDAIEVVDCASRKDQLVGLAVPDDHLAAELTKALNVVLISA